MDGASRAATVAAPWRLDAGTLAAAYRAGWLTPVEVFEAIAARQRVVQPRLNPVAHWDAEGARAQALASTARWRQGRPLSPLDGVPLTVKDNIPVAGLPCRWGSRLYADHVPARDELAVARLRAAGAVILGKTQVPEFTLLGYTDSAIAGGPTRNPWDPALTPGGSSGGAVVAVATGLGPLALATDGGGSIRRPCSHAGVVGLKPGHGCVPRADGLPELLPGLEEVGPIARSVGDLVRMLAVLAPGALPPRLAPATEPLRIVSWRAIGDSPVDAEVLDRIDAAVEALRGLGHQVELLPAPAIVERFNREAWPVLSANGLRGVLAPIALARGQDAVAAALTPAMRAMWEAGLALTPDDLARARALVRELHGVLASLFEGADVILTPSAAALPWPAHETHPPRIAGREAGPRGHAVFTAFANACGLPGLALPLAPSAAGLPVGMQLVGARGREAGLCALGLQWEAARPWAARWPELEVSQ